MKRPYDLSTARDRTIARAVAVLLMLLLVSACGVVKVKKPPEPAPSGPLKAMTFESGDAGDVPRGWTVRSYVSGEEPIDSETPKHKIELTKSQKHGGKMSAVLGPAGKEKPSKNELADAQFCGEAPFPDSAVRVSAFMRGEPAGTVRFNVSLHGTPFTSIQNRGGGWTKFELVSPAPIPDPASTGTRSRHLMCIGVGTAGSNRVWIDDVTFARADLALPPEKAHPITIDNLDMERFDRGGTLANWINSPRMELDSDRPPLDYELRADRRIKRSGAASLLLKTDEAPPRPPGESADYCMDPTALRGKTLRVAGWIRADVVEGLGAGVTFGVFATPFVLADLLALSEEEREDFTLPGETRSSDMFIERADDWTRYQLILFVPNVTTSLCINIRLDRVGSVWADDLSVEVVEL